MTRRLRAFALLGALVSLPSVAHAACDEALLPPGFADVVSRSRAMVAKGDLPSFSFAVARQGKLLCEDAFGWADREARVPATPGAASAVSIGDPPGFGLPTFISLRREQ